jgi:hypothetical protein
MALRAVPVRCAHVHTHSIQPAVCFFLGLEGGVSPGMILLNRSGWEIAGGVAAAVLLGGGVAWLMLRKRPTEEELERQRRQLLVQSGRLVDGMLLDLHELAGEDGRTLTMLLFSYRIGGVDYECSQDITSLNGLVDPAQIGVGFPCSVRYQPGNPQNSIVVAENWSGLRATLPRLHTMTDPDPVDTSQLRRKA